VKLSTKLVLAIGAAICVVLGVNAWLRVLHDRQVYEADVERDHRVLAGSVASAVSMLAERDGVDAATTYLEAVNAEYDHVEIGWRRTATAARTQARSHVVSAVVESETGERYLRSTAPVYIGSEPHGIIELSESLHAEEDFVRSTIFRTVVTTGALLLLSVVLLGVLVGLLVGRPLRALAEHARRVGAGDLQSRLSLRASDEIGQLAAEMNAMSERLAAARAAIAREAEGRLEMVEQLRHSDRLRTVGELASGIAHELGTPLSVVRARGAMIASGEAQGDRARELGKIIVEQSDRMTGIIRQILDFGRRRAPRRTRVDLGAVADRVAALVQPIARRAGVKVEVEHPPDPVRVKADAAHLEQALTNLVVNAVQASSRDATVTVRVAHGSAEGTPEGDRAWSAEVTGAPAGDVLGRRKPVAVLEVEDRGTGVAPEHVPRLFEPFFTTKKEGEGTGLGLSITRGIVEEHGGTIEVRTEFGTGTTFRVTLPIEQTEAN
jgi:signal transduction histidine kinase